MAQLWPHFESYWDFKSTRGSLDMIHLIIYASQVLWWILEVNTALEAKETFLSKYKLDLQSIGSSPDIQRWLIQARQIQWSKWGIWTWDTRFATIEYKSKRMSGRRYRWKSPQIHILRQGRCVGSSGNGGF